MISLYYDKDLNITTIYIYVENMTNILDYDGPRDKKKDRGLILNNILNDELNDQWVSIDKWRKNEYNRWVCDRLVNIKPNYYLFSILADVRNWFGITPIDEPRGIPDDCSSGYSFILKEWDKIAHTHSYFTLEEILNVDWNNYDKDKGVDDFLKEINKLTNINDDFSKVRILFFFAD